MENCSLGRGGPMCGVTRPRKFDCNNIEYYTQGRGRGLYPPGQGPPWMLNHNSSYLKLCGRGRGPYLSPFPALPKVGAAASEAMEVDAPQRDLLPKVGAHNTRARPGPRRTYATRVVRSSRPSPAAIQTLRQERRERESCWATHGSLHQDKPDTVIQPCKRHCPEAQQFAVTLQPWTGARVVEGNY